MKEMTWRVAALKDKDLTAGDKVVMMALLIRADWETWQGTASVNDLAELTAMSTRGVKLCLKRIEAQGWVTRHANRRDDGLHHKATFKLNADKIDTSEGGGVLHSPYSEQSTQPIVNKVPNHSEQSTQPIVNKVPKGRVFHSPNINSYQLIDQHTDQQPNQPHNQPSSEVTPSSTRESELDDMRRAALKAGCYLLAPEHQLSWNVYVRKMGEVTRLHSRQDVRDAYAKNDHHLLKQAHELRIAPSSMIDWVVYLATEQKASKKLIRR
jgi:hypothetical protein